MTNLQKEMQKTSADFHASGKRGYDGIQSPHYEPSEQRIKIYRETLYFKLTAIC